MLNDCGKHNYFPSRFCGKNTENSFPAPMSTEKLFSAPKMAETLNIFRPVSAEKIRKNIFRTDLDGKCFSVRFPRKTDGKYVRCISKPTRSVGNQFKCPSSVQHAHKGAHNTICFFPCRFAFQIVPDMQLLCVGVGGCALKLLGRHGHFNLWGMVHVCVHDYNTLLQFLEIGVLVLCCPECMGWASGFWTRMSLPSLQCCKNVHRHNL